MIAERTPQAQAFLDCRGGFALPWLNGLQTARLSLRTPVLADAEPIAESLNRFAVARMLPALPFPYDRQDALEWLLPRASGVHPGWAFAITRDDLFAGTVTVERMAGQWTLGYWLAPPFWGRRYASEAVRAVVEAFLSHEPEAALHASVLSDNPASFRLLSALGFEVTGCREVFCQARGAMKTLIELRLEPVAPASRA